MQPLKSQPFKTLPCTSPLFGEKSENFLKLFLPSPFNLSPNTRLNYNTIWVITLFECFSFAKNVKRILPTSLHSPFRKCFRRQNKLKLHKSGYIFYAVAAGAARCYCYYARYLNKCFCNIKPGGGTFRVCLPTTPGKS